MTRRSAELDTYQRKRDFSRTAEPEGKLSESPSGRLYLIQKHAARRLHYDLRLELGGVLKSWALPKGPSLDPEEKRLAVQVEDHPVEYGSFEGIIPAGEYGGGTVMLWDQGEWESIGDPEAGLRKGHLSFRLHGKRLQGSWTLARLGGKADPEEKNWLLIKKRDEMARVEGEYSTTREELSSIASGRSMEGIAGAADSVWKEGRAVSGEDDKSRPEAAPAVISIEPAGLPGVRKAPMPKKVKPQLAIAVQEAPPGEQWLHEIKYDGYRLLCFIDRGNVRLLTRRGQDWTEKFSKAASAAASLPLTQAILDGEMVVLDEKGVSDFQALQNFLRNRQKGELTYFLFDILHYEGYDLTRVPLAERKELLRRLLPPPEQGGTLRYSDHFTGRGEQVFQHACRFALEGIISKRAQSIYLQKRSSQWRKVKCLNRQEFVIGGFSDPGGGRSGLGALLLGYYETPRKLVFSGKVGTGFSEEVLRELRRRLEPLERASPPFVNPPAGAEARGVHWVRPELVAEVEFTSWTQDGRLRHPSYKGLREDKAATEIRLEEAVEDPDRLSAPAENEPASTGTSKRAARQAVPMVAGVRLSNPERILYPDQGVTKRALAEFYERIADFAVPHLAGRPLSLFRCPQGRHKECFFQKHFADGSPEHTRIVPIREKQEERDYLVVDDLAGVISLVQLGVLEFHPWASREDRLEQPDRMVFDLDPDPGIAWEKVIEGAFAVRDLLGGLGLRSFLKTTGGKGLHVVVPLVRRSSWEEVKAFSRSVAERLVEQSPRKYVATMSKSKRQGRIFIDHFRNSRGATAVAAYSTRARSGATVSTPLRWEELIPAIRPDHYTIENLPRRLARIGADPWEGFFEVRQSLTRGMKEELESKTKA
jgi:bifunctional non-homologous end joining protein LigD